MCTSGVQAIGELATLKVWASKSFEKAALCLSYGAKLPGYRLS